LLDAEAAGCDRLVERLRDLQASVDRDDEKGRWAWGGMSEVAQRAVRAEHDTDQMALCSTCGQSPTVTDGGDDRASDDDWHPEPADLRDEEHEDEDSHAARITEQLRMLDDEDSEE
jgi:hypothetical protein